MTAGCLTAGRGHVMPVLRSYYVYACPVQAWAFPLLLAWFDPLVSHEVNLSSVVFCQLFSVSVKSCTSGSS